MEDELGGGGEGLAAEGAVEGLARRPGLARVLGHVGERGEGLVAGAAQEGLVAVVRVHVAHQAGELREGRPAPLAPVAPLAAVRQPVALQVVLLQEPLAAPGARPRAPRTLLLLLLPSSAHPSLAVPAAVRVASRDVRLSRVQLP